MTTNTKVFIGVIVAILLGAGFLFSRGTNPVTQSVGAVNGPNNYLPYFNVNDVYTFSNQKTLATATTTVCAIKSPSSTSTLVSGTVNFSVSSSTASTVTLAKASTAFATTTSLGQVALAASSQGSAIASTTGSQIFSPNTYFVVGMQGGTGTFSPSGSCIAVFQKL